MFMGLSPRVRGNRAAGGRVVFAPRSIPACTGEPAGSGGFDDAVAVYPRVYGGTSSVLMGDRGTSGLSPRVRGNLSAS